MWEIRVQSLGQEDPLEKEMATHSGIFAWEIPWTAEPSGLQSMGSQRVGCDLATKPPPPKTVDTLPRKIFLCMCTLIFHTCSVISQIQLRTSFLRHQGISKIHNQWMN